MFSIASYTAVHANIGDEMTAPVATALIDKLLTHAVKIVKPLCDEFKNV